MLNFFTKIFGTKSQRDLKELNPYVPKINEEFRKLSNLSDDELRAQSADVKNFIDQKLQTIDNEIAALHQKIADAPDLELGQKEDIFNKIDKPW